MLETLHLTKVYKTKGGADVKALDDVSIRFPEKGMVFLLGRSGSGKSTLLNVCGGLDSPTGGAIIVKGRSSNAFSQSDFDSYRNTFVGFIFQEYNILNEFTVEDNIALALELQGKPKDKRVIAELLEQVDLTGYAKRKPNTLSGGQKQRIAIARALVKSPEIIMADEPTGALDSATGKQVFDTLKKLSKDKLVIVVSHDRDFAETYGDRIIELKDGKVLSDVTKTEEQQQAISENISVVGATLCVKKGAELTEEDFAEIRNFLSQAASDVIIAGGEQEVKSFKKANHIKENGEQEVFRNSEEIPVESRQYRPEESRFIRSKLPIRHAIKIGLSGMKTKPVRLIFTILLCTVAFIFFGLLSTMTFYDSEATFKESLQDSNYSIVQMGKVYNIHEIWHYGDDEYEYDYSSYTRFTEAELEQYAQSFGENAFGGVSTWGSLNVQSRNILYWVSEIRCLAYLQEDNALRADINGRYPEKDDEICISSYTAEVLFNCKVYDRNTGSILELSKPEDIIGKKITLDGVDYTVVGILNSGEISPKYEALKESDGTDYQLYSSMYYELQDGLHLVAFVTENCVANAESYYSYYGMDDFSNKRMVTSVGIGTGNTYVFPEWSNAGYSSYAKYASTAEILPLVSGKTEPGNNDVIVSQSMFCELLMELYWDDTDIFTLASQIYNGGVEYIDKSTNEWNFREFTEEEAVQKLQELIAEVAKKNEQLTLGVKLFDDYEQYQIGEVYEYAIIGVWYDGEFYSNKLLFADSVAEELWSIQKQYIKYYSEFTSTYVEPADAIYETIFLPYNHSDEQTNQLWKIYENKDYAEDGSKSILTSALISNLETVDSLIDELSKVFFWVGLVLAVFAALLLSNFISVSISYKKREIGILRAVGARSIDVFKIFFSESFAITAICVVISLIGSVICCSMINEILVSLISAALFVFGPLSLGVLLVIAFATAVIATFLPVWNAAKKKPVESIRAL